jgi:hypothetical protein
MRTAFVFVGGVGQIVLTPQGEEEKRILALIRTDPEKVKVSRGSYYLNRCQGGWIRQFKDDESLIITMGIEEDGKDEN